jgi:hypothetical protein
VVLVVFAAYCGKALRESKRNSKVRTDSLFHLYL